MEKIVQAFGMDWEIPAIDGKTASWRLVHTPCRWVSNPMWSDEGPKTVADILRWIANHTCK